MHILQSYLSQLTSFHIHFINHQMCAISQLYVPCYKAAICIPRNFKPYTLTVTIKLIISTLTQLQTQTNENIDTAHTGYCYSLYGEQIVFYLGNSGTRTSNVSEEEVQQLFGKSSLPAKKKSHQTCSQNPSSLGKVYLLPLALPVHVPTIIQRGMNQVMLL